MPSRPSWLPGAETSGMVAATLRSPVTGSMRVMDLAVRSVTHNLLSGPQVISHGPPRPETRTFLRNCLVPRRTESGLSCATAKLKNRAQSDDAAIHRKCLMVFHYRP